MKQTIDEITLSKLKELRQDAQDACGTVNLVNSVNPVELLNDREQALFPVLSGLLGTAGAVRS